MPDRPAADEGFGDFLHLNCRLNAGENAALFEGVLERQGVDHGRQHPHVVAADAVHPGRAYRDPSDNVAAADRCGDLNSDRMQFGNFLRDAGRHGRVHAEALAAHESFTAQFEQNAPESGFCLGMICFHEASFEITRRQYQALFRVRTPTSRRRRYSPSLYRTKRRT